MSPYLFSADLGATEAAVLSISDLFTAFAEARAKGDKARMAVIRKAVKTDPELAAEFDGFDYLAAA